MKHALSERSYMTPAELDLLLTTARAVRNLCGLRPECFKNYNDLDAVLKPFDEGRVMSRHFKEPSE